jgi:hypothetical protein
MFIIECLACDRAWPVSVKYILLGVTGVYWDVEHKRGFPFLCRYGTWLGTVPMSCGWQSGTGGLYQRWQKLGSTALILDSGWTRAVVGRCGLPVRRQGWPAGWILPFTGAWRTMEIRKLRHIPRRGVDPITCIRKCVRLGYQASLMASVR